MKGSAHQAAVRCLCRKANKNYACAAIADAARQHTQCQEEIERARNAVKSKKPVAKKARAPKVEADKEDKKWSLLGMFSDLKDDAVNSFNGTLIGVVLRLARSVVFEGDELRNLPTRQLAMLQQTGQYLHDLREVAGLTLDDLAEALDLSDKTLLQAVEEGTAALSFELILRLAAILAKYDPVPFIFQFIRTYSPETWETLDSWGIGLLPLQFERERRFVNILRQHNAARDLSDQEFADLLKLTDSAFNMGLNWYKEKHPEWSTQVEDKENDRDKDKDKDKDKESDKERGEQ